MIQKFPASIFAKEFIIDLVSDVTDPTKKGKKGKFV